LSIFPAAEHAPGQTVDLPFPSPDNAAERLFFSIKEFSDSLAICLPNLIGFCHQKIPGYCPANN
jgi:hypothetical protein